MIVEVHTAHKFDPVNECVYCGETEGLTDEHIIPYALGGNLILPQASCKPCAAITSRIELKVLRGFMHDARLAGNFPSRRKKNQPKELKAKIVAKDESITEVSVPVENSSGFMILPMFSRPHVLDGKPPTKGVKLMGTEAIQFGKDIGHLISEYDAKGFQFGGIVEATEFSQLLAKIAYCYLIAWSGIFPRAECPLLPLIRGESDDGANWVGSGDYKLQIEEKKPQHALAIVPIKNASGDEGAVVRVKLFANSGATGYEVATRIPGWECWCSTNRCR